MKYKISPSNINGEVQIPGSKSHTIRALVLSLLASGESTIKFPLVSSDTISCCSMIEKFGARIHERDSHWHVQGVGGNLKVPDDVIDIGNSGTSLYIGLGIASIVDGITVFTGDEQIRNRSANSLVDSINQLGGESFSTRKNGNPPIVVKGQIKGGETSIEAITSQYLTALLMACPFAKGTTRIDVPLLNEKPYITMTLDWLDKVGIQYENNNYKNFIIKGNQSLDAFEEKIPADFSSATFFLVAAAISGNELSLRGLDFNDSQGDKEVVNILKEMGIEIEISQDRILVKGGILRGGTFDLNSIPDSLPALAVAACFAEGETRLVNVPQARVKETDRIKVMNDELKKMGAKIEEMPDGLIIKKSELKGSLVNGHSDHRVVMALSVAGLFAKGESVVTTAEAVSVTFPNFLDLMNNIGAKIDCIKE